MGVRSGKGDKGLTSLLFRKRVRKDSIDICALGDLDELNCHLGLVKSKTRSGQDKIILEKIQRALSAIDSEIVVGSERKKRLGLLLKKEDTDWIKNALCRLEQKTIFQNTFFLPGDGELSALLDIARAVARRAERSVIRLLRKDSARNDNILAYLNCLSDVLFVMARAKAAKKPAPKKKERTKAMKVRKRNVR